MQCPKCHSHAVHTQVVTDVYMKHRGCLGWCLWLLLSVFTCGTLLIIPMLTNSKIKSNNRTMAVCQQCGKRWTI